MNTNIMKVLGSLDIGYVLDWQVRSSEFIVYNKSVKPMFDTRRTEIGEALFQLKYKQDQTKIEPLAETMAINLKSVFHTASFVIPIPPSKNRATQPAVELARKVSEKMNLPFF